MQIISSSIRKALQLSKDKHTLNACQARGIGADKLLKLDGDWDWQAMKPIKGEMASGLRFRLRLMADSLPTRWRLSQRYPDEILPTCPLCKEWKDDPDDPEPLPIHDMAHVLGLGNQKCNAACILPNRIAAAVEGVLRKARSHPLVPLGQSAQYAEERYGSTTLDVMRNPPVLEDCFDPMISINMAPHQRQQAVNPTKAPLSTLNTAHYCLGIATHALASWFRDLKDDSAPATWLVPHPALGCGT